MPSVATTVPATGELAKVSVYMPDAVAAYTVAGSTYFVTANEGDAREYSPYVNEVRIKSVSLDTTVFPNATALKQDSVLGRLKILTKDVIGDTDGDGDYDELYCFGARSFSIWNQTGTLVWDSKNAIEKFFETNYLNFFNCNEGKASLKDGAVLSSTVIVCVCDVSLPAQSVTVQVLASEYSESQAESVLTSLKITDTEASQLSVAVKVSAAGTLSHSTVASLGSASLNVGSVVS